MIHPNGVPDLWRLDWPAGDIAATRLRERSTSRRNWSCRSLNSLLENRASAATFNVLCRAGANDLSFNPSKSSLENRSRTLADSFHLRHPRRMSFALLKLALPLRKGSEFLPSSRIRDHRPCLSASSKLDCHRC